VAIKEGEVTGHLAFTPLAFALRASLRDRRHGVARFAKRAVRVYPGRRVAPLHTARVERAAAAVLEARTDEKNAPG